MLCANFTTTTYIYMLEKEMATTPVFLPGEFQGQKSLANYSPWGHRESDTNEQLIPHYCIYTYRLVPAQGHPTLMTIALNLFSGPLFKLG